MESFKEYIAEGAHPVYVVVKNNRVELRRMGVGSPVAAFGQGAVYAVLTGDHIQVNLKNGKTVFYKLSNSGLGVSGPYIK